MLVRIILLFMALAFAPAVLAERITIAAASDLKGCLDEVAANFRKAHAGDEVELVYGSSGKFKTQIEQGAPFDLFFSADIAFPAVSLTPAVPPATVTVYVRPSGSDADGVSVAVRVAAS